MAAPSRRRRLPAAALLLLLLGATAQAFLLPPSPAASPATTAAGLFPCPGPRSSGRCWAYYFNDTASGGHSFGSSLPPPPPPPPGGRVTLVGAGPGDPELLTLAAVKALGTAELVIADRLIPGEILE